VNKGVAGAIAVILLWLAFVSFYVAFHPGGITSPMFADKTNNPTGQARNPRDVFLYFIDLWSKGIQGAGNQQLD
jgi:hypothetical protein